MHGVGTAQSLGDVYFGTGGQGDDMSGLRIASEALARGELTGKTDPNNGKFQKLGETYKTTLRRYASQRKG